MLQQRKKAGKAQKQGRQKDKEAGESRKAGQAKLRRREAKRQINIGKKNLKTQRSSEAQKQTSKKNGKRVLPTLKENSKRKLQRKLSTSCNIVF